MADYQAMYAKLFNKITDIITQLQEIQREAEEIYIASALPNIHTMNFSKDTEADKK